MTASAPMPQQQTGQLNLVLRKWIGGQSTSLPATARGYGDGKSWKKTFEIPVGEDVLPATLDVPAGAYSVSVVTPGGETLNEEGEIGPGGTKDIILEGAPSAHEWLSWANYSLKGQFGRLQDRKIRPALRRLGGLESTLEAHMPSHFESTSATLRSVMGERGLVRSWRQQNGAWLAAPDIALTSAAGPDPTVMVIEVSPSHQSGLVLVEVRGEKTPQSEFCIVPTGWRSRENGLAQATVVVDIDHTQGSAETARLRVRANVQDGDLTKLAGFMQQGAGMQVAKLGDDMAAEAEQWVWGKARNPWLATAAALALLKARRCEELHDWTYNLAEHFPHIPDGATLRAWHLLFQKKQPQKSPDDDAFIWLLKASERGLPLFSQSLQFLIDGLRLYRKSGKAESGLPSAARSQSDQAKEKLALLEPYLWAGDPDEPFTSYRGTTPDNPGACEDKAGAGRQEPWSFEWSN